MLPMQTTNLSFKLHSHNAVDTSQWKTLKNRPMCPLLCSWYAVCIALCPLMWFTVHTGNYKPSFMGSTSDIHCSASLECSAVSCGWRRGAWVWMGFVGRRASRWGKGEGRKSSQELLRAAFLDGRGDDGKEQLQSSTAEWISSGGWKRLPQLSLPPSQHTVMLGYKLVEVALSPLNIGRWDWFWISFCKFEKLLPVLPSWSNIDLFASHLDSAPPRWRMKRSRSLRYARHACRKLLSLQRYNRLTLELWR